MRRNPCCSGEVLRKMFGAAIQTCYLLLCIWNQGIIVEVVRLYLLRFCSICSVFFHDSSYYQWYVLLFPTTWLPEKLFRKGGVNNLVFCFMSSKELLTKIHFENFFGVVMHEEEIIAFVKSQGQAADLSYQGINTFNFKVRTDLENSLRNSKHELAQYLTKDIFKLGEHLKWYFISKLLTQSLEGKTFLGFRWLCPFRLFVVSL